MFKQKLQVGNVPTPAASGTVTVDLPRGKRIHAIILQHGYSAGTNTVAAAATNVSEIRVLVNSRIQRQVSGTELRDLLLLNGTQFDFLGVPNTAPGVSMTIPFAEPWRQDPRDMDTLALPTNTLNSVQLQVTFGAASTPTLAVSVIVDDFQLEEGKLPNFTKWVRAQMAAAGTSFDYAPDMVGALQQMSFYVDSGGSNVATKVTLRVGGRVLHELTNTANKQLVSFNNMYPVATGRTATIYDVVIDHDGLLASALVLPALESQLIVKIEAASAMSGTVTGILQRYGPPD